MLRTAKTENGIVRGLPAADPRITSFKGVPFAAPPVGENRWRAPQPAANWEGVRDCFEFAPISVQDQPGVGTDIYCREWHVDPDIPMGEDCLYLNIWTPAKKTDEKLPVLIWYFGGGFQWGYTAEMEFDGERIARRGIIVVSVNYRLGALGFLVHPEITKNQPEYPANFGHLDQQAGLRWVHRNIAAFGGDPDNITIAGQSAGGGSTLAQITCDQNKGLIKNAVIMSGMIKNPYMDNPFFKQLSLEEAGKLGEEFFTDFLGVKTLEEARKLDAFFIRDKYAEFRGKKGFMFATCQDGVFCNGDTYSKLASGKGNDVNIIAGNTVDEFPSAIFADSEADFEKKAKEIFGADADKFLAVPGISEKKGDNVYASVAGIECAVKNVFTKLSELGTGRNYYYYRFNPDIPGWDKPGSFHSVDLWFWFETLAKCWRPFVGRHYDLARQMCDYICNFIKKGDPNADEDDKDSDLPEWRTYSTKDKAEMNFIREGSIPTTGNTPLVDFITDYIGRN
ncbi:MAG: carboxylesterase family protein [Lachnospiraceae bacterium]|nr:carboxylesterase family protein [Lachnospiraceae bacterium]